MGIAINSTGYETGLARHFEVCVAFPNIGTATKESSRRPNRIEGWINGRVSQTLLDLPGDRLSLGMRWVSLPAARPYQLNVLLVNGNGYL